MTQRQSTIVSTLILCLGFVAGCGPDPVAVESGYEDPVVAPNKPIAPAISAVSPDADADSKSSSGFPLGSKQANFGLLEQEAKSCILATWSVDANAPLSGEWCSMTADLPVPIDSSAHWQMRQAWEEPKVFLTVNSREVVGAAIEETLADAMAERSDNDKPWDAHTSEREFDHDSLHFQVRSSVSQDPDMSFLRVSFKANSE